jgi:microcystin degradation protein MlrC
VSVIQIRGVTVVLIDSRRPFHSLASFESSGVDPLSRKIVVVKQGYLSPELRDRASRSIMALTPGFTDLRLEMLPYRRLNRPIYPLESTAEWPLA